MVFPAKATDDVREVGEVELVVVGVKAWQVPEAAQAMKPLVGSNTTVLPMQNGVDAAAQLANELGSERVVGGLCRIVSYVVATIAILNFIQCYSPQFVSRLTSISHK